MRSITLLTGAAVALGAVFGTLEARADSMDPALGRLTLDENCRGPSGNAGGGQFYDPSSQFRRCRPHDAAFAKLIAQYGQAVAPVASYPARTTGFGGYRFGIQSAFTTIDDGAHYWQQGTEGPADPSQGLASIRNDSPDGVLQMYSLNLAKGFPFGIELGASFGYLVNTEIISGGGDVRMALFEGFRDSIPGYFPDLGVGGQVRTITGTSAFKLTVVSFDAGISKPIPVAGTITIQPHIGYQLLWIFGDSGLTDLTPNTDPLTHCGWTGENNPATPDTNKTGFDGQPVCRKGADNDGDGVPDGQSSSADFNNNVVFDKIRLSRHRLNWGIGLRYQMITFNTNVSTDLLDPVDANPEGNGALPGDTSDTLFEENPQTRDDPSGNTVLAGFENQPLHRLDDDPRTDGNDRVTRQWTIAIELGAHF
jgi:hypothetical protein